MVVFASLALGPPAVAETLRDALKAAYQTSPLLNAERDTLRGTDAGVALARSEGRPQVAGNAGLDRDLTRTGLLFNDRGKGPIVSGGVDINLPLFLGGRVRNATEAARARVEAGRATLKAVEGTVFVNTVQAYMDVIRDRAIVELDDNQVVVLATNLRATGELFTAGDLTRTDIAQSEARLNAAKRQLDLARARLAESEETYLKVVGLRPGDLAPPPPLPPLPASASETAKIAMAGNPTMTAALHEARAAGLDVSAAHADRLPTLSGTVGANYINYPTESFGIGIPRSGIQTTVGLTTRIPLYQGGAPAARIRQARASEGRSLEAVVQTERSTVAEARSAFASYEAAKRAITSSLAEIAANELALRGVTAERRVGTRTVIEVLNAEQELLTSKVELLSANHDAYLAGFRLLNAMGQANPEAMALDVGPLYDPVGNYRRSANDRNDWSDDPRASARSTSTLDLAAASPQPAIETVGVPEAPQPLFAATIPTPRRDDMDAPTMPAAPPLLAPSGSIAASPSVRRRSGAWMIQLGAFRTAGAPQALFARLASRLDGKLPTYLAVGGVTRLLVGPYPAESRAVAACRSLRGVNTCLVTRAP